MRIVQTLWSGGKNLLEHSYGWRSPEYHLMGWALSCLKLREHYNDLQLYTDDQGAAVLTEELKLPYSVVHREYDALNHINNDLWALPKILTYQAQKQPFMHVDGDVFIWERFSSLVEEADLIAQNFETGTDYYKRLIGNVKRQIAYIPHILRRALRPASISSYNAGVLGGNDIEFIQRYCKAALKVVYRNQPTNVDNPGFTNFNILYEQVLFHAMCAKEERAVTSVLSGEFTDNGYTKDRIADWSSAPKRLKYLHLIGQKKQDREVCDLLSRTMLREYPEQFFSIKALFPKHHLYFYDKINSFLPPSKQTTGAMQQSFDQFRRSRSVSNESIRSLIYAFELQLAEALLEWRDIPAKYLFAEECRGTDYFDFFFYSREQQLETVIERNQYLQAIESSFEWCKDTKQAVNGRLNEEFTGYATGLVILPQLFEAGCREVVIDELSYNILALLDEPVMLKEMLSDLSNCFPESDEDEQSIVNLILVKLRSLFMDKCIFIKCKENANDGLMHIYNRP